MAGVCNERELVPRCPKLTYREGKCIAHYRAHHRQRNAKPERQALYTPEWDAESRAIRAAHPICQVCGVKPSTTVDHPTRLALCHQCHGRGGHGISSGRGAV